MIHQHRILQIGIAPEHYVRQRLRDIVSGKVMPDSAEPKVWASSLDEIGRMLNEKNMLLIEVIRNSNPASITELATLTNRAKSNVKRTLDKLADRGLVTLEKDENGRVRPRVDYDGWNAEYRFERAA